MIHDEMSRSSTRFVFPGIQVRSATKILLALVMMMPTRRILLIVCGVAICAMSQWAKPMAVCAGGVFIFTEKGSSPIVDGDLNKARTDALIMAKQKVLQTAILKFIPAIEIDEKRRAIEKEVIKKPDRFFVFYETVSETKSDGQYTIIIETRLDKDSLVQAVRSLPTALKHAVESEKTILILVTYADGNDKKRNRKLEKALASRMETLGLGLADERIVKKIFKDDICLEMERGHFKSLARIQDSLGIQYVFMGRGYMDNPGDPVPAHYRFYLVNLIKGEVVADFPFQSADGALTDADGVAQFVLAEVIDRIKGKGIIDDVGIVEVKVVIQGMRNFSDAVKIRRAIKTIPSVEGVILDSARTGKDVSFIIKYAGKMSDMVREIESTDFGEFKLRRIPALGQALIFRVGD